MVRFDGHCDSRFGHRFFTKDTFVWIIITQALFIVGRLCWQSALKQHGDTLNGIAIIAIGAFAVGWLLYRNFGETNFLHGVAGSALQIVLFVVLGWIVLLVMTLLFIFRGVFYSDAKPVCIVNK
ncbi:putative Bxe protein (plasmid) [Candidatus Burkholderia crenata]|nr:putative Bxe protein [Candidatus Burkholderia crenata]